MKNLIEAVKAESAKRLSEFVSTINAVTEISGLTGWYYSDLVPRGRDLKKMELQAAKSYLISRKQKALDKEMQAKINKVERVSKACEFKEVKIQIEWKKSRMWGANPKAEAWIVFTDQSGNTDSHYATSESISGCGYDKTSTAVAQCLNQFNEVLKPLYLIKDRNTEAKNRDIIEYGAGSSLLPYFEGGVGVSSFERIFKKIGYEMKTVASGKTYDVFSITKSN